MENIIFDIGNVLLKFDPESYLLQYFDEDTKNNLMMIIFASEEWDLLDLGNQTTLEVIDILSKRYPEYQKEITFVLMHWTDMLKPIEENIRLVYTLKEKGYALYLLSNFHNEAYEKVSQQFDFFKLFDGGVISYELHEMKPTAVIYRTLLKKYHLNPAKSIFIDDMLGNILTAQRLGIDCIWLNSHTNLESALKQKGIL